jgi:hypothetical protein
MAGALLASRARTSPEMASPKIASPTVKLRTSVLPLAPDVAVFQTIAPCFATTPHCQ